MVNTSHNTSFAVLAAQCHNLVQTTENRPLYRVVQKRNSGFNLSIVIVTSRNV